MTTRTNTPTPSLCMAGSGDVDTAADIVADAFLDIEAIQFLVPDHADRRQVSRDWYRLYIEHAIGSAGQVVMTEDASAAAVWLDRTGEVTEPDRYAERLAELAGPYLARFQELDREMDAHHPAEPHWYLLFLAVLPDRQSQGLGSLLMNHTHTGLDAGIPAYLEATSLQNRRLYQRHHYTDMDPATFALSDGTLLYRMWRPPQG
jgi:GNAT superfamily N-acetyltransferase